MGLVINCTDVTERRENEIALRFQSSMLHSAPTPSSAPT